MSDDILSKLNGLERDLLAQAKDLENYNESGAQKQGAAYRDAAERLGAMLRPEQPEISVKLKRKGSGITATLANADSMSLSQADSVGLLYEWALSRKPKTEGD